MVPAGAYGLQRVDLFQLHLNKLGPMWPYGMMLLKIGHLCFIAEESVRDLTAALFFFQPSLNQSYTSKLQNVQGGITIIGSESVLFMAYFNWKSGKWSQVLY